ncbi:hypothetical protein BaRGS_00020091 [Batillaria attramentaria]|uniref:Uncharacterized protein n=1 Tax=Batillaria attramentaria TaxID=370345 RepID=A0ABD0KP09_9CAEN
MRIAAETAFTQFLQHVKWAATRKYYAILRSPGPCCRETWPPAWPAAQVKPPRLRQVVQRCALAGQAKNKPGDLKQSAACHLADTPADETQAALV